MTLMRFAWMTLALVFVCGLAVAQDGPSTPEIKDAAQVVLANPIYNLDTEVEVRLDILGAVFRFFGKIWQAIQDYFDVLGQASPFLKWAIIAGLVLLLIGLIGHIGYTVKRGFAEPALVSTDSITSKTESIDALLADANRLADAGNYVDASRLLYRASLIGLEEKRGGRLRVGLTNLEYLETFKTPWVRENLRVFVDLINWKWYRDNSFDASDFDHCMNAYAAIKSNLMRME